MHWIGGRALAAFSNKVALINVEAGFPVMGRAQVCYRLKTFVWNMVAAPCCQNGHAEYLNVPALRDPAVSPLGPHVAVAGPSSCMLWDLRRLVIPPALGVRVSWTHACRSVTAVEMAWPGGFTCRTLARLVSDHTLVAGGFGQVPLHYMDLRMPSNLPTYPVPGTSKCGKNISKLSLRNSLGKDLRFIWRFADCVCVLRCQDCQALAFWRSSAC